MARGSSRGVRNRVSDDQLEQFITYMEQHPLFARGQITRLGPQGHIKYKSMWDFLMNYLNQIGPSIKDVRGWQNVWRKARLSAKMNKAHLLRSMQRTGHNEVINNLSVNDERICDIYGKYGVGSNLGYELGFNFVRSGLSEESFEETDSDEDELLQLLEKLSEALNVTRYEDNLNVSNE